MATVEPNAVYWMGVATFVASLILPVIGWFLARNTMVEEVSYLFCLLVPSVFLETLSLGYWSIYALMREQIKQTIIFGAGATLPIIVAMGAVGFYYSSTTINKILFTFYPPLIFAALLWLTVWFMGVEFFWILLALTICSSIPIIVWLLLIAMPGRTAI